MAGRSSRSSWKVKKKPQRKALSENTVVVGNGVALLINGSETKEFAYNPNMIYGTLATMFFHDGMSTKRKRSRTFSLYTYELNREAVNTVPKRMTSRVKLLKFKSNLCYSSMV